MNAQRTAKAPEAPKEKHTNFTQIPNYLFEEEPWVTERDKKGEPTRSASESVRTALYRLISKLATNDHRYIGFSERDLAKKLHMTQSTLHRALPVLRDLGMVKFAHLDGKFYLMVKMADLWRQNDRYYAKGQEVSMEEQTIRSFFGTAPDVKAPAGDAPEITGDATEITGDADRNKSDAGSSSEQGGNTSNIFSNTFLREGEEGDPPAAPVVFSFEEGMDPETIQAVIQVAQDLDLNPSSELVSLVQMFSQKFSSEMLRFIAQETRGFINDPRRNKRGLPMSVSQYHTSLQYQADKIQKMDDASKEKMEQSALPPPSLVVPSNPFPNYGPVTWTKKENTPTQTQQKNTFDTEYWLSRIPTPAQQTEPSA